ncbi:MAG: T9SS type A sorting domain-containing protein, partial [Bacteroidota bacterium]
MSCELLMPTSAKIIVEKGGNLVVTSRGSIKDACLNQAFTNIYYESDLAVLDGTDDTGAEPSPTHPNWESPSIWVKNAKPAATPGEQHENPVYRTLTNNGQNYVYVKIKNNSFTKGIAKAGSKLRLYWAHAATGLDWDRHFNGSTLSGNQPSGGQIGDGVDLTGLTFEPNGTQVIEVPWSVPNPGLFADQHFCLLARIEDMPLDPYGMTYPEDKNNGIYFNVRNNNNIAQRNTMIVAVNEISPPIAGGSGKIKIRSVDNFPTTNGISFDVTNGDEANTMLGKGKIKIDLSRALYDEWVKGGKSGTGIRLTWEMGIDLRQIVDVYVEVPTLIPVLEILAPHAYIGNINFKAKQSFDLGVRYHKTLLNALSTNEQLNYHIGHYREMPTGNVPIGGEEYIFSGFLINAPGSTMRQQELLSPEAAFTALKESGWETTAENSVVVYPNPAVEQLTLSSETEQVEWQAMLFDLSGKLVHEGKLSDQLTIQVSDLPHGTYSLVL